MRHNYRAVKDTTAYHSVVSALRSFFIDKGFVECHTQDRLSILAACEDPTTVGTYTCAGELWPLPQTGQMWLEYELLTDKSLPGVFCISTSYRNEQNPIPGRHEIVFPMFEFESRGTIDNLRQLETELCEHLGFGKQFTFNYQYYETMALHYGVNELTADHEKQMASDFSPIVFLENFPLTTSPFWNMKKEGNFANKIDVIIEGAETIGSAERSCNPSEMHEQFHAISNGKYAQTLFDLFGHERVERELDDFLSLEFVPRYGGGIGLTRLIKALEKQKKPEPTEAPA